MSSALDDALTGFIALSKQAKAEGIDRMEDVAEVARGVREARAELAALRDELQDWRDGAAQAASERCGDDRHHCTCVPALRKRVGDLEKGLGEAREDLAEALGYVSEYFREKWKMDEGLTRIDALLTPEARERIK